jgi:hypothetical protein
MVDYQNGKIYKIISNNSDLVYIGSTAKYKLKERLAEHVSNFECGVYYSSCELIKQPHYDIIEIEAHPCNSKVTLEAQERFWMLKYRDGCINVVNERPSGIEADNMTDYNRQYYLENKEKIADKKKQYYQDNKDEIEKYKATKVTCGCGCEVRKDSLLRHKKTQRHLSIMSTMQSPR